MFEGSILAGFWDGVTDPKARSAFKAAKNYFLGVWDEGYPDMPPGEDQVLTDAQLADLDRRSFREELEGALGGPLHPHMRSALELYCWSSFGGTLDEISAAAGLNFFTAESAPVCALPGGNGRLAERLLRGLRDAVPPDRLRTQSLVTRVEPRGDHVAVQILGADGRLSVLTARTVVMACPKFIAARLLPDLPDDQIAAIRRLKYRSYLTANVLCKRPPNADFYDMYLLADQPPGADTAAAAEAQGATDVIMAQWAAGGHPERAVLTLYRGFPYDGARAGLLDPATLATYRDAFTAQVATLLPLLGLAPADVEEVRVARFGHALPLAATGLFLSGGSSSGRTPRAARSRIHSEE